MDIIVIDSNSSMVLLAIVMVGFVYTTSSSSRFHG
jgi:hypothetical protein